MKQYSFLETKAGKIAFGGFLFAMLLLARDTLITSSILGFHKSQFLMLGLICAFGLAFLAVNRHNLKAIATDRRMLAVLLSAVILLLPMFIKRDWQMMYCSVLVCLFFAVFLTYFTSSKEVARYYIVILAFLGAYSVLSTYVLRALLGDTGLSRMPYFFNQIDVKFFNFGLAFVSESYVKNRNFGIFREPGVYQYFVLLALFLNNYTADWEKSWQRWTLNTVLSLTMLTTLATGGIIELGLLAVVIFFDKKLYKNKGICLLAVGLIAVLVFTLAVIIQKKGTLYWELYAMFVSKFSPEEESGSDRFYAIFTNLSLFLKHPLVGEKLSTVLHAMENNTSSTLILYAVFGVAGGTLNAAAWAALVWDRERKLWANLSLLVILFMSFNTQNLIADIFFWLFPCMALVERGLPRLNLPEKRVR